MADNQPRLLGDWVVGIFIPVVLSLVSFDYLGFTNVGTCIILPVDFTRIGSVSTMTKGI